MISCDCSVDDYDRSYVGTTVWRKARKPHKCCECGDTISRGDSYEYVTGCWDGSWSDHKTCQTCVRIRERYCPNGWIYGGLAEQIEYCLEFDYRKVPEDEEK